MSRRGPLGAAKAWGREDLLADCPQGSASAAEFKLFDSI